MKDPVKLLKRVLSDNTVSLYTDTYYKGKREKKAMDLYLLPGKDPHTRQVNKETEELARLIIAEKNLEFVRLSHGFPSRRGERLTLADYFAAYESKHGNNGYRSACSRVRRYDDKITLARVDRRWVVDYIVYLAHEGLAKNTIALYFSALRAVMSQAVKEDLIRHNPVKEVESPEGEESNREHLTIEELQTLQGLETMDVEVRNAFLFSCFTGLRKCDIRHLRWRDVRTVEGFVRIHIRQQKTGELIYLDINPQAAMLLGERSAPWVEVFRLPTDYYITKTLNAWMDDAGITKHITYHCARHTFAMLMMAMDVDLGTTQKLLGHTDIKTTMIYAKMFDSTKRKAVMRIPKILED